MTELVSEDMKSRISERGVFVKSRVTEMPTENKNEEIRKKEQTV